MKCVFAALTIATSLALVGAGLAQDASHKAGAVFVMTNAADKNQVIAYNRDADGTWPATIQILDLRPPT
jgi:hypothetical protein